MTSRTLAWAVHLLTASGVVFGLLAIEAVVREDWRSALGWMVVAMVVDSFDGSLARAARVREVLPEIDGELLDNLVDYLNYVLVPAVILLRAELLPVGTELVGASLVALSSAYQFCQKDAKTHDHFFKGFPSFWNVVVLYMLAMRLSPALNLAVLAVLVTGVFVPIKWAYPSRMLRLRALTILLPAAWGASVVGIVLTWPDPPAWLLVASLAYVAYYAAVSLFLGRAEPAAEADPASR